MEWSTLVPVVVGGALSLGGGLLGSWFSDRRAVAREDRERVHEREVWARELKHRAHVAFLTEFNAVMERARDDPRGVSGQVMHAKEMIASVRALVHEMEFVGNRETQIHVWDAVVALQHYLMDRPSGATRVAIEHALHDYRNAVRRELGLPTPVDNYLVAEMDEEP